MKSILFVCLGNICRSPLAEGIAREIIKKHKLDIKVDSAGISAYHSGDAPDIRSIKIAKQNGIGIEDLRSRQVNLYSDKDFDLLIAMDSSNYQALLDLGFKNVRLLGDFGLNGKDIKDPYLGGEEGFSKVYNEIKICIEEILEHKL